MEQLKGMIFNIQRYSVHDGSGIRTNLFFKGCPLSCVWCSNPESQRFYSENTISPSTCVGCMGCVNVCPVSAVTLTSWDRETCISCRKCEDICPTGSRKFIGNLFTVDALVEEALKDQAFYRTSDGGVTLSGGEPLAQWQFAAALAEALRLNGMKVAIETCGHADWEHAEAVLSQVDEILFDLKHMDSVKHKEYTGVGNELILANARNAARLGKKMTIRVPVIGGCNDSAENILATAEFAREIGADALHLLPFHRLGENKYQKVGMDYHCDAFTPDVDAMKALLDLVRTCGINAQIGG